MSNFPINPESLSYTAIKKDLTDWLSSLPDAQQWSLFYESSSGQQIIELIAGLSAMSKFDNIVARREAYMPFAQNRSSKIAGGQFLGYSAYRGQNAIVEVTVIPRGTGVWNTFEAIGTVKEKDLIVLEDITYNSGVEITFKCVIGEVKTESKFAESDKLDVFRFTEKNVSEHVRVFIDSQEVDTSQEVSDLINGKFQVQSNSFGSVDAKYLNLTGFQYKYNVSSEIKLEWVALYNLSFTLADIRLDESEGTLIGATLQSLYIEPETNKSIEINAPLRNETKMHVRGRKDQGKVFKQLDNRIISASGETITSAIMKIYYVLEDGLRYTPTEKLQKLQEFEPYRPHGLLPPLIEEGHRAKRTLSFNIVRQPRTVGDPLAKIDEILGELEYKLGESFNLYDIESTLESEDYIKVARVKLTSNIWEALNPYEIGSMVKLNPDNGFIYEVIGHYHNTSTEEPIWPDINNEEIIDGSLIWKAIIKSDVSEITPWSANNNFSLYQRCKPTVDNGFCYEVVSYVYRTGISEPVWPKINNTEIEDFKEEIADGNIIWKALPLSGEPIPWASNIRILGGEYVIPTNPKDADNVGIMYQAHAVAKYSSNVVPEFPTELDATVDDGNIVWQCKDPLEVEQEIKTHQYFIFESETVVS